MGRKISGPGFFLGKKAEFNFGAGQSDLAPPREILKVKVPKSFLYGEIRGQKELVKKVASLHNVDEAGVVITNGASEAIDLIFSVLLNKNDKVLLTKPYYYSYPFLVKLNKGQTIYTELREDHIDLGDLEKKISGCKAFLLNSPANPTGSVEEKEKIREIQKICKKNNAFLVFDEVYSELTYEKGHYSPKEENVISVNSFSKTFALCGLRVGYLYTENKEIAKEVIEHKTHKSMNTSTLSQLVALNALKVPRQYIEKNKKIFKERRDIIYDGLKELGLKCAKPEGAFYILPHVKNPQKVVEDLYKENVILYNGKWFGAPNRIRLSYAIDKEKIKDGLKKIKKYLEVEKCK